MFIGSIERKIKDLLHEIIKSCVLRFYYYYFFGGRKIIHTQLYGLTLNPTPWTDLNGFDVKMG